MEGIEQGIDHQNNHEYHVGLGEVFKEPHQVLGIENKLEGIVDDQGGGDPEDLRGFVTPSDELPDLDDERGRGFFLMAQMVDYWRRGDAEGLARLVIEDELKKYPEFADLHRRMFDDRNRAMTGKVLEMQQKGGTYFVVVGAGHLVGDQGIVAMLKERGQSPRQL